MKIDIDISTIAHVEYTINENLIVVSITPTNKDIISISMVVSKSVNVEYEEGEIVYIRPFLGRNTMLRAEKFNTPTEEKKEWKMGK